MASNDDVTEVADAVTRVDVDLLETGGLLDQARRGDAAAREALFRRYRGPLARFLHLRLPLSARSLVDTEDVVQETCAQAFLGLGRFEYRGVGSFWGYLRRVGINRLSKAARAGSRRARLATEPDAAATAAEPLAGGISPLDELLGKEEFAAFDRALGRVPRRSRDALLMRLELGLAFDTIASECGYPSGDAVRMSIGRTMDRVAEELSRGGFRH